MRTIDADRLIEIIKKNPKMRTKDIVDAIDSQITVVDPQKALVDLWNRRGELNSFDEKNTEAILALDTMEDSIIASINPIYRKNFSLEKPPLTPGDKLYYMDYEESGNYYTIIMYSAISPLFLSEDRACRGGVDYSVHADGMPPLSGHYPVFVGEVDTEDGRFFSHHRKQKKPMKNFY